MGGVFPACWRGLQERPVGPVAPRGTHSHTGPAPASALTRGPAGIRRPRCQHPDSMLPSLGTRAPSKQHPFLSHVLLLLCGPQLTCMISGRLPPARTLALSRIITKPFFLLASVAWPEALISEGSPLAVPRAQCPSPLLHNTTPHWVWAWGPTLLGLPLGRRPPGTPALWESARVMFSTLKKTNPNSPPKNPAKMRL